MNKILSRVIVSVILIASAITIGCARQDHTGVYIVKERKQHAWLGVQLQDVSARLKEREGLATDEGAYVSEVIDDSPAEKAGLKEGDVIVKFDGTPITDSDDLTTAVHKTPPKSEVKVEVLRKAEKKTLTVTLGKQRAPEAYSYHFEMPSMPRMQRMPRMPRMPQFRMHVFTSDESYGLEVQPLNKQLGEYFDVPSGKGLLISEVEEDSKAEKAGFKAGDVITKINGHTVRDVDDFHEELSDTKDSSATFDVMRKGKSMSLSMKIRNGDDDDEDDDDYSANSCTPSQIQVHVATVPASHATWFREQLNVIQDKIVSIGELVLNKIQQFEERIRQSLS